MLLIGTFSSTRLLQVLHFLLTVRTLFRVRDGLVLATLQLLMFLQTFSLPFLLLCLCLRGFACPILAFSRRDPMSLNGGLDQERKDPECASCRYQKVLLH